LRDACTGAIAPSKQIAIAFFIVRWFMLNYLDDDTVIRGKYYLL